MSTSFPGSSITCRDVELPERTPDTITLTKQLASVAKIVIDPHSETTGLMNSCKKQAMLPSWVGGRGDLRGVLVEVCRGGL